MDIAAIMLADSRFPGGGHVHSGGLEEAAARRLVTSEADLPVFLLGRLRTAGELAAVFAAAAAHAARRGVANGYWFTLDAELDARTPSMAQRAASRAQGAATARAGRLAWPSTRVDGLLAVTPRPHHAVILGALIGAAGGLPVDAGICAGYLAVSGAASAAVRLLGLDPLVVNASVAALSSQLHAVGALAVAVAAASPADLPGPGAPGLDLLAESHHRRHQEHEGVRLFAS